MATLFRRLRFYHRVLKNSNMYIILSVVLLFFMTDVGKGDFIDKIEIVEVDWNYPLLNHIPNTGFQCRGRSVGYYADDHPSSSCQVFHYCHHDGRMFDFLCPNSTIFNQKVFACDHFYNFECSSAKDYYILNEMFYNGTVEAEEMEN